jgi:hypothetical protein
MFNSLPSSEFINSLISISMFNEENTEKILDEVANGSYKIVIKDDKPICIIVSCETYKELLETIEKFASDTNK